MVIKYTLRNLNQLKRELIVFESEYESFIKNQYKKPKPKTSKGKSPKGKRPELELTYILNGGNEEFNKLYGICRRFIVNQSNGVSVRKRLQDFKDSIPSLLQEFETKNKEIAIIRSQLFGRSKEDADTPTPNFPRKINDELVYLNTLLDVINAIINISKFFGENIIMTKYIYTEVYMNEKFNIRLNNPLKDDESLDGLDEEDIQEVKEKELEDMQCAIAHLFLDFSPICYFDFEIPAMKKLDYKNKSNLLSQVYDYLQNYKKDILKLSFAIRANKVIELRNKEIDKIYQRRGNETKIRKNFPKISHDTFINKLNLNKSTVSDYFTGKAMPSAEFLLCFSQTVGISIDYLINPAIPVGYLKQEMSDKSNMHCVDTSIEIGYLMRFLNHRWRHINTATLNQTDLIMTTLTYLMRDLFIDNVDDGIFPTLSKGSYPLKKMNASSTASSLTAANDNFHEMVLRYNEGSLRLNKNSLLYLIGRILFDRYPSEDVIPEGLKRFSKDYMITSGKGSFQRLAFLAQNNCQNPLEYKAIINQLMTEQDELASDCEELLLDCEDDLEQYFKEQLMARLRNTLSVHSNLSKNSTMSDEKLPQFTPYHDYNEDVWDNVQKKYISLKPKDSIILENNGFSNSYAKFLSPQKSEKENKPKNIAKFCRLTPITIQLGSMESSDYEIRKAIKEYLQAQNVAINEIPNHIELSVEALDDFESMCYAYSTNPQIFEYSYPTLCTVRAFIAQNHIPVAFFNGKQYAPSEKPLVNDLCKIFETNPDLADKSFEELLRKKGLFSKKTRQIYLNDMETEEEEE